MANILSPKNRLETPFAVKQSQPCLLFPCFWKCGGMSQASKDSVLRERNLPVIQTKDNKEHLFPPFLLHKLNLNKFEKGKEGKVVLCYLTPGHIMHFLESLWCCGCCWFPANSISQRHVPWMPWLILTTLSKSTGESPSKAGCLALLLRNKFPCS